MFTKSPGDDSLAETVVPSLLHENYLSDSQNGAIALRTPTSVTPKPERLQKNWGLLRKLHRATLIARQQHFPSSSSLPAETNVELEALRQVASRGEVQKSQIGQLDRTGGSLQEWDFLSEHAAPLSPMRERDLKVLADWFQQEDMAEIETEVAGLLLQLFPEPCWEDDPFSLIQEFL